jgi:kynureninase
MKVDRSDVGIAASLTNGMHSLLATFYRPDVKRNKIIMLKSEFTSDILAAESWLDLYGLNHEQSLLLVDVSDKDPEVAVNNILSLIEQHKDSISVVALSLMSSHFSHYYDVAKIRQAAKKYGILTFVDLAHSLGCVPINLTELDIDAAYLSSSKYMNSGPGCVGGIYINPRFKGVKPGLRGWFGTDRAKLTNQDP